MSGPAITYPTPPRADQRKVLGHGVTRLEDLPLITGRGRYAGDINFPQPLSQCGPVEPFQLPVPGMAPRLIQLPQHALVAGLGSSKFPAQILLPRFQDFA